MPFISAAVGLLGAAGSFIGSIGIIGRAVLGIGINLLVSKFQKDRAKKAQKSASGVSFEREYGENISRKVACGLIGIAGHDCYVNTSGSSNKLMSQVYVFSDYPCDGLSKIWAGGVQLTLTTGDNANYVVTSGDMAGLLSFRFYNGQQGGADVDLVSQSNPLGRWTTSHIGAGQCYIIAFLTYHQEKLSSFPDFFFEIRGARLYDPRKDSTVGGSGAHRWGNYSTHEFSQNPIIMDYNYRRGFSWYGDTFLGMEMLSTDLPIDRYAVAANICDENVGGEARYRCSVIFDADVAHGDNIEAAMTSCGGIVIDAVDGSWPLVGTDQAIVETFTDDDLVTDASVRYQRRRSMADLVNSVSGTYPEPSNLWSPTGYDPQSNSSQVALDRRTRDVALNLETTPSKRQANQLASIYYNENRYEATADITLRPRFQTIKTGDWVAWDSARYGYMVWMVQSRSIQALTSNGPRNVSLSLQQRDGSIYAGTGVIPPTIPIPPGEPIYLNELQDYAIIAVKAIGADGRSYAAFRISWSPIDDVSITGIYFEWWIKTAPANVFSRQVPADVTIAFIQEGIVSLTEYEFRYRLLSSTRPTSFTAPITVTSIDGGNADQEVYLANLQKEVLDVFDTLFSQLGSNQSLLEQLLVNFQLDAATSETSRRRLSATVGNNKAEFDEQIVVLADELSATAAQTTALSATVGDITVAGLIKFGVAANQTGVDARFSVLLRSSTSVAYKESGFFLELYTSGGVQRSRFAILADQFVVTNGTVSSLPMVFEGGALKLQIANIGIVTAGILQSPNGKMVINLNAGTIVINS